VGGCFQIRGLRELRKGPRESAGRGRKKRSRGRLSKEVESAGAGGKGNHRSISPKADRKKNSYTGH